MYLCGAIISPIDNTWEIFVKWVENSPGKKIGENQILFGRVRSIFFPSTICISDYYLVIEAFKQTFRTHAHIDFFFMIFIVNFIMNLYGAILFLIDSVIVVMVGVFRISFFIFAFKINIITSNICLFFRKDFPSLVRWTYLYTSSRYIQSGSKKT